MQKKIEVLSNPADHFQHHNKYSKSARDRPYFGGKDLKTI